MGEMAQAPWPCCPASEPPQAPCITQSSTLGTEARPASGRQVATAERKLAHQERVAARNVRAVARKSWLDLQATELPKPAGRSLNHPGVRERRRRWMGKVEKR